MVRTADGWRYQQNRAIYDTSRVNAWFVNAENGVFDREPLPAVQCTIWCHFRTWRPPPKRGAPPLSKLICPAIYRYRFAVHGSRAALSCWSPENDVCATLPRIGVKSYARSAAVCPANCHLVINRAMPRCRASVRKLPTPAMPPHRLSFVFLDS